MQDNLWHHKSFHFHFPFWIWKVWRRREKIKKIWIFRERKELFRWNKKLFYSFWKPIIWWKNQNLIKNSGFFQIMHCMLFCNHEQLLRTLGLYHLCFVSFSNKFIELKIYAGFFKMPLVKRQIFYWNDHFLWNILWNMKWRFSEKR